MSVANSLGAPLVLAIVSVMGLSCGEAVSSVVEGAWVGQQEKVLSGQIDFMSDDDKARITIVFGPDSKVEIRFFVFAENGGRGYEYESTFRVDRFDVSEEGFDSKIFVRLGRRDVEVAVSKIGRRAVLVSGLDAVLEQLTSIDNSEVLGLIEPYVTEEAMNFTGSVSDTD